MWYVILKLYYRYQELARSICKMNCPHFSAVHSHTNCAVLPSPHWVADAVVASEGLIASAIVVAGCVQCALRNV